MIVVILVFWPVLYALCRVVRSDIFIIAWVLLLLILIILSKLEQSF